MAMPPAASDKLIGFENENKNTCASVAQAIVFICPMVVCAARTVKLPPDSCLIATPTIVFAAHI
jgi:hypothetical protein